MIPGRAPARARQAERVSGEHPLPPPLKQDASVRYSRVRCFTCSPTARYRVMGTPAANSKHLTQYGMADLQTRVRLNLGPCLFSREGLAAG